MVDQFWNWMRLPSTRTRGDRVGDLASFVYDCDIRPGAEVKHRDTALQYILDRRETVDVDPEMVKAFDRAWREWRMAMTGQEPVRRY